MLLLALYCTYCAPTPFLYTLHSSQVMLWGLKRAMSGYLVFSSGFRAGLDPNPRPRGLEVPFLLPSKSQKLRIENSILHRSYDRNTSVLWFCLVQYHSQRALIQAAATLGSSPQPANPCSMLAVHVLLKLGCVCYVMGASRTLNIEGWLQSLDRTPVFLWHTFVT